MKKGDTSYTVQIKMSKPGWYKGWEPLIEELDYATAVDRLNVLQAANPAHCELRIVRLTVVEEPILPTPQEKP